VSVPARTWIEGACTGCERFWRCPAEDAEAPVCSSCGAAGPELSPGAVLADGSLAACMACGHDEMYWARDFPRRFGIAVVVVAAALAPFTWYLSLAAGAVVDASLVFFVRKRLHCYRCAAVHHGFPGAGHWRAFDLEVADLHRFGAKSAVAQTLGAGHAPRHGRRLDSAR